MSSQKLTPEESRTIAKKFWFKGEPSAEHTYADKKGVPTDGTRVYGEILQIPGYNADKQLCTVLSIFPNGDKRFLNGTIAKGAFCPIGKPTDGTLYICEGWATGMSIHAATGHAVAVAFSSSNLGEVARLMRDRFPNITLIIAADNDKNGNAIKKAEEAALQYDAWVVFPEFTDD